MNEIAPKTDIYAFHGAGEGGVRAPDMDPITFEVLRNAFTNTIDEMAVTVKRAAYSTNVKTRGDFSCVLIDLKHRVIAQAGQPGHLVSMSNIVPVTVKQYGEENIRPGDGFFVNDPHRGANHLNDITCFMPVFVEDRLFGYVANMAHHVDVGGASPASLGVNTEIFQEGVILPGVRVMQNGEFDRNVLDLFLANVRARREVFGDLRAQMSANVMGARNIAGIVARYSAAVVAKFFDELMSYTDRWVESELRRLPQGTFRSEAWRDDDGVSDQPVRLCAAVTLQDGQATLDVTGSSPQQQGPINVTRFMTRRVLSHVLRCLIDKRVPNNSALLSRIHVAGPDGLVLTALPPAAVVGAFETTYRLVSAVFRALHPVLPDRIPAAGKSLVVNLGFAGWNVRMNEYYCFMETVAGGDGARPSQDGMSAVQAEMQNTENAPIEEVELSYPIMFRRYELIPDSGGAGRFRGGLGVRRDYWFPYDDCRFSIISDGRKFAPWGLAGGADGSLARYTYDPEGEARDLPSKISFTVPKGKGVRVEIPGGGGFGDPRDRDPEKVRQDVRNGYVSVAAAEQHYGVKVDPVE